MEIRSSTHTVLYNKLINHFKNNIKLSFKINFLIFIMTKDDIFYSINIKSEKIPDFIINDDKSTIETMIVKELCF